MNGDAAGHEVGGARHELERLIDASPEVETRRATGGILRQRIAQSRVEDPYVECLQTKSRLAAWQQLRDVLDQLAREHDLGRERQLVRAVLVEKRERIGVLAKCLLREVRRKQRDSLGPALRLRVRFQVFRLGGETYAERSLRERRDLAEDVGVGASSRLRLPLPRLILCGFGSTG